MSTTRSVVTGLVLEAVRAAATKPSNSLQTKDVASVSKDISDNITPAIQHATNTEVWFRSRVTWGAIGAILLPILGALGVSADIIEPDEFVALGVAAGTVFSGLVTLYGRWAARKPIGE